MGFSYHVGTSLAFLCAFGQELKLEDCDHGQIMHLVAVALAGFKNDDPHKEILRAFVMDKQLDGITLTSYKRKAFATDIAKFGEDKKLRGKAVKLWKSLHVFNATKTSGNQRAVADNANVEKKCEDDHVEEKEEQKYPQNDDTPENEYIAPKDEGQILESFCSVTHCDREIAVPFLKDAKWNLPIALERFYAFSGDIKLLESWTDTIHRRGFVDGAVYTEGIRLWYWAQDDKMPSNAVPVSRQHPNLKDEMLATRYIGITSWRRLYQHCTTLIDAKFVRNMTANGIGAEIYDILLEAPFEMQWLLALKLYTDFNELNGEFCEHFRLKQLTQNTMESAQSLAIRNAKFWNFAKLLTECVQCFGQLLMSKKKRYYRGINRLFLFPRFVARFYAPLSTSKSVCTL